MDSNLIVDVSAKEVSVAVLEDSKLVELQREKRDLSFAVGDIYIGKVKKIMHGLNATFIDVGYRKDAFLHYYDLGLNFEGQRILMEAIASGKPAPAMANIKINPGTDLPKDGKIADVIKVGQPVLVQIVKEPISTKGPRLSSEISLAGRNLVLVPFSEKVSVSNKINSSEEKTRLKHLVLSIKPKNFGVIVRTSAQGKKASELDKELKRLLKKWEDTISKLHKVKVPKIVFEETNRTLGILRDTFNSSFSSITVNDTDLFEDIKDYISEIASGRENIVQLYTGAKPLFDEKGVTKQIKALFGRTVTYKSGAYLIIEQTEAMHVVDVNSGNRSKNSTEQEATAVDVNMSAAEELARQLRLRDMGGIIVVDFIDMQDPQNRQQLYEHMVKMMSNDRARHNILPLSKFGLMQITRQRVRPSMQITTDETCPVCLGSGKIESSILFVDKLQEAIKDIVTKENLNYVNVHIHPYLEAYVNKGWFNTIARKWKKTICKGIKITANESLAFLEYKFFDKDGNEIEVSQQN